MSERPSLRWWIATSIILAVFLLLVAISFSEDPIPPTPIVDPVVPAIDCRVSWLIVWNRFEYDLAPRAIFQIGERKISPNPNQEAEAIAPRGFRARWRFPINAVLPDGTEQSFLDWIEFDLDGEWTLRPKACPNHVLRITIS